MRLEQLYLDEGKGARIAALLAMGLGAATIAKRLNVPEQEVRGVASVAAGVAPEAPVAAPAPTATATPTPPPNYTAFIERHEGRERGVYRDSMGIPTIGVGFNLRRSDAAARLSAVGANLQNVLSGAALTDEQINTILGQDVEASIATARQFLPNFDAAPAAVKLVLVDMAFNLGPTRLNGFRAMRAALTHNDYARAADEMVNSRWFTQVGNRSRELEQMMRAAR